MKGDIKMAVALIVEEAGEERMYLTDATFKSSVETLVQMLPFMVQGLANECRRERVGREKAVAEMLMSPWTRPLLTDPPWVNQREIPEDAGLTASECLHFDCDGERCQR